MSRWAIFNLVVGAICLMFGIVACSQGNIGFALIDFLMAALNIAAAAARICLDRLRDGPAGAVDAGSVPHPSVNRMSNANDLEGKPRLPDGKPSAPPMRTIRKR